LLGAKLYFTSADFAVHSSILPQNGLHFAAKWPAFCRKMDCILPQNGLRFAAKWKVSPMCCRAFFCKKVPESLGGSGIIVYLCKTENNTKSISL